MTAPSTISSPFAFGNLQNQFGWVTEPVLSRHQEELIRIAGATDDYNTVVKTLPPVIGNPFTVSITHDIDWLDPYHPFAWVQSATALTTGKPRIPFRQLWKRDLWLRNCERMLQTEQQYSIQSIWCLGAQPTEGIGRFDIRYSSYNPLLKELIALIQQYNQEIGLHSSFDAVPRQTLKKEADQLQQLTGKPIQFHRSHYLNAKPTSLYEQLDACGITFDLGWGYPRKVALKNGIPGMFSPLQPHNQTVHRVKLVPLVMMDNVLFVTSEAQVLEQFSSILSAVQTFNGTVCMLLHPENFLLKPSLWDSFTQIIDICNQKQAVLKTPKA